MVLNLENLEESTLEVLQIELGREDSDDEAEDDGADAPRSNQLHLPPT